MASDDSSVYDDQTVTRSLSREIGVAVSENGGTGETTNHTAVANGGAKFAHSNFRKPSEAIDDTERRRIQRIRHVSKKSRVRVAFEN